MRAGAFVFVVVALFLSAASVAAEESSEGRFFQAKLIGELGFLQPVAHEIQFSKDGTLFDYVDEGGQDILFGFARLSVDLTIAQRHTVTFLYQPLSLETAEVLRRDVSVDGQLYAAGTSMALRYDFPFYRVSYLYDLIDGDQHELALGGSLQVRDARIEFSTANGENLRTNRNVGPVPVIRFRGRYGFDSGFFLGTEMDGFYAPIKYINGGKSDVVGAILDASLRAGVDLDESITTFFNIRYLGGGAEGTSSDDSGPGDGFNKNWLHFLTASVGFSYAL